MPGLAAVLDAALPLCAPKLSPALGCSHLGCILLKVSAVSLLAGKKLCAAEPEAVVEGGDIEPPAPRTVLKDVELEVEKGSLCVLVGAVGAGKTSLIHALLGEMEHMGGSVEVDGTVAYSAQSAFIMNVSLQLILRVARTLASRTLTLRIDSARFCADSLPCQL